MTTCLWTFAGQYLTYFAADKALLASQLWGNIYACVRMQGLSLDIVNSMTA